jgi:CBS domain-containing protein
VIRRGGRALPLVDAGRLVGIVSVTDAEKVSRDRWASATVGDVATTENLAVVAPGDPVDRALKTMAERGLHQLLVLDGGALVGVLTRSGILGYLALHRGSGHHARPIGPGAEERPPLRPAA